MKDFLENDVKVGDTVLIATRAGRTASIGRGFVVEAAMKRQFRDGPLVNMVKVEWSNIHKYWMPASKVVAIPPEMLPEKRREKKLNAEEGVVVSEM